MVYFCQWSSWVGFKSTQSVAKNFPKCVEKIFSEHYFLFTWEKSFNNLQIFLHFITTKPIKLQQKKLKNAKKHSPSLILLSQCFENYSLCLRFFLGIMIEKNAALDHSEVAVLDSSLDLDLKKNLGSHFFNLNTQEKSQITLGKIF